MQNSHWIAWKTAAKASNMPSQGVWNFTPVSYRTSALWGRCPALPSLLQLITPSRASGTADHVRSLDDLFLFFFWCCPEANHAQLDEQYAMQYDVGLETLAQVMRDGLWYWPIPGVSISEAKLKGNFDFFLSVCLNSSCEHALIIHTKSFLGKKSYLELTTGVVSK